MHGGGRRGDSREGTSRADRVSRDFHWRARRGAAAALPPNRSPLPYHRPRSPRGCRARDRALEADVLLGMALDAAGHRLPHHVRPSSVTAQATAGTSRKAYLDWLRGVAVIVMIQGHVIDSWTLAADKNLTAYRWITFIGGIAGAPLFLFLAGVALALAAASRLEKGRTFPDVAALARRRGWQIFGLAFLFRLQSWLISGGPALKLLKVDILNVMGLSMVAGAVLWALGRSTRMRIAVFVGAAVACAMVTPLVRTTEAIRLLPDPVEWYLIPAAGTTAFTLLPWAGFLFAGAACGVLLEAMRSHAGERSANFGLAVAGVITAAAGYAASFLP